MNDQMNEKMIEALNAGFKRMNISHQKIQTWNSEIPTESIEMHLRNLDLLARRYEWDDDEKINNLILSIRGQARNLISDLADDEQEDYELVRNMLVKIYGGRDSRKVSMREIQQEKFNPHRENIREFISRIAQLFQRLGIRKADESNHIIREHIIEKIGQVQPELRHYIRMNQDCDNTFDEWASWLVQKFENFNLSSQNEETVFYNDFHEDRSEWPSPDRYSRRQRRVKFSEYYDKPNNESYNFYRNNEPFRFNGAIRRNRSRPYRDNMPYSYPHFSDEGVINENEGNPSKDFIHKRWERPDHSQINELSKAVDSDEEESLNF